MFPARFDYHRAGDLDEALSLLGRHDDAKVLAGGHSLLPMMKLRLAQPGTLVDIGRVAALRRIDREGDVLAVGALATHRQVMTSDWVKDGCPILAEAAGVIGDPQVRNVGTVGGNIAHADPASDLPAVLVALGATVVLQSADGERRVAAEDFFLDLLATDLKAGEILTHVEVPVLGAGTGSAYVKFEHPASGYAVVGAAAVVTLDGKRATSVSLAFNGAAPTPAHATAVAEALEGGELTDDAIARAVDEHLSIQDPMGDHFASGEYRVSLAATYGKRALAQARDRAGG